MRIDIITLFTELIKPVFEYSIMKRAIKKNLVSINCIDLRDFSTNKQHTVDDYSYGGGAGMVMQIEPIVRCIDKLKAERHYEEIIFMSPDGEILDQPMANRLSTLGNIIILCGHYKGVDERVRQHYITREISIGNYVLSGGELPAAVLCDTLIRLIPGVISDETSALTDSFQDNLLAPPVYSRPAEFNGMKMPDILLSGNEKEIEKWRFEQSIKRTIERRPGLIEGASNKAKASVDKKSERKV